MLENFATDLERELTDKQIVLTTSQLNKIIEDAIKAELK